MSFKNKFKNLFTVEDDYEYEYEEMNEASEPATDSMSRSNKHNASNNQNVVSLKSVQSSAKVVLCEPRSYDETQEIADHIVNRRSVVINLQRVDFQQAKRIVDFLGGTVYAVSGEMQKLGPHTFLCTPDNVDVSGSITQLISEDEDYEQGW
ncbi:cell division protein SepF [Paraliobacillus ryukyuensis]|uniref:Cell division protein SepF n=1 Tax=Paraliobacillus ryukyuensis TaxID=200904 RepID=A0A366EHN2_9BACI|nr:cell division protein SepF [Paraliobacillus ryukyuensis]RBP01874.1 cell division inhibitor SepF [Paraliobacillus ryukyuensis]